ncbi:MAG: OmpA family protein [Thiotrichales bacterium]|nr:OmpA family protein [Thiotrichales bacterium]
MVAPYKSPTSHHPELEQQATQQLLIAAASQKKPKKGEESGDDWLVTYADSITLLMAFFVLILSVSDINQEKFEAVNQSLNTSLLNKKAAEVINPLTDLQSKLSEVLMAYEINPLEAITLQDNDLRIDLPGEVLFGSASAELEPNSQNLLSEVAKELRDFPLPNYSIEIEGHSDDDPINTIRFPSNWELSSARAISVLKLFMAQGVDKDKLKAIGYADSRPKVDNRNQFGEAIPENQKLNRRVEIMVSKNAFE